MPPGYYRFPTIWSDNVVFVSEDDLWSVPAGGGVARRLTSNLGEVTRPFLSPDGTQLAFVGWEEGQAEIYVMPAMGGSARRLTYMGGRLCLTAGWTADGKILFANNAEHWYLRFSYLYAVDLAGSPPSRLDFGLARAIAFGPQGGVVLGRNTDDPARWKRYRGGTTGQIWIDEHGQGDFRPLLHLEGNLASPMWIGERIYFISDHEGIGNLYSCLPSGADLHRHSDHAEFYARNATTDGKRIVYHAGADLFLFDPTTGSHSEIPVEFYSSQTQRNRKFVDAAKYMSDWSLHPKGHSIALTTRGKLFSFANWEGAVTRHGQETSTPDGTNSSPTGVRYRLPQWLKDGKRLIAVTDLGGEEAFVIFQADGSGEPLVFNDLDIGRPEEIAVNPQKDQIAFSNHRYELSFLDLETHSLQRIDRGVSYPITGFDWSPDGEWLAYSASTSLQMVALKLWRAATSETFPLAEPVLKDVAPAFDPNGKYLYFLSYRTFDPVSDRMQFDLGFPRGMKPYLITLQADLTSPFLPKPRLESEEKKGEDEDSEAKTSEPEDGTAEDQEAAAEKEMGDQQPVKPVQIDLDGIASRVLAFPVQEGIYGRIGAAKNGKVLYSRYPVEGAIDGSEEGNSAGRGVLMAFNFDEQKEEMFVNGITDFKLSTGGEILIYRADHRLRVIKAGEKPNDDGNSPNRKTGWIKLSRVKVSVLPGAEWRQMFREAWRLQRDQFWTPDMSQVDWVSVHDRYLPLVDRVSSRSEFSDLMWEMQGELGTSHAYEFGGDYRPGPNYVQGRLGADFRFDAASGGWEITFIHQGDSWDHQSDSPLNAPGVNVQVGDKMLAVNGQALNKDFSPAAALVNLAGQEVTLSVLSATTQPAEEAGPRTVTVKTLSSDEALRYREWVNSNRQRVHAATQGKVGYLHIPDMGYAGYAEFHRGFLSEVDRQGLIVDLRFNRGGMVSALLLEKLGRKRIGYDIARWSELPSPYPPESVLGPMVALTNEYAGSDGDIFSHGFKIMQLGPLLGKRTWGGVVGIWPRFSLVDGTQTTQPEFSFWFKDVGWGVENYGTDPDIEVDILPQDYKRGIDTQLERAIQEIQKLLETNPPDLPDFSKRPSRALPKLPKA